MDEMIQAKIEELFVKQNFFHPSIEIRCLIVGFGLQMNRINEIDVQIGRIQQCGSKNCSSVARQVTFCSMNGKGRRLNLEQCSMFSFYSIDLLAYVR